MSDQEFREDVIGRLARIEESLTCIPELKQTAKEHARAINQARGVFRLWGGILVIGELLWHYLVRKP